VSIVPGQEPENQLRNPALRRGSRLTAVEYTEAGVSAARDRRPAPDQMPADAKRRRSTWSCWRLDRLGRNLRHLVTLIEELRALRGVRVTR
jgi:DNA invertase Pin-like site-specific DNA recombinase